MLFRLQVVHNNPKEEMAKFQASIDDDNFAVGLINNVVKAFLAATDPTKQVQYLNKYLHKNAQLWQILNFFETAGI